MSEYGTGLDPAFTWHYLLFSYLTLVFDDFCFIGFQFKARLFQLGMVAELKFSNFT